MTCKNLPLIIFETSLAWRNELDKRLKPLGLSQAKWRVLVHLSLSEKKLSQAELARRLGIEGPTLVGLLDRLAKDGWLTRQIAKEDRRTNAVHLTAKAEAALKKIHAAADALRIEVLEAIPKKDLEICEEVMKTIKLKLEEFA